MKQLMKKGLSLLLAFVLILGLVPVISLTADAATVDYRYSGNYIYNWGTREEVATFLSPNAEDFYEENNVTYMELAALSGSSNESSVPSSALYKELAELMSGAQTYTTSYDATKNLFQYTDCQNSGSPSTISSFYSGTAIGPSWDGSWNREHTWPNSKGDKAGSGEDDIMMLRPTSTSENSSRGNKAYGQSSSYYNPNGESDGTYDLRGDVARIVLYVYVRWGCTNTGSGYNPNGIFGVDGVFESKELLLDWMEEDPVDTWELGRNDSVESITGTRNVFVDYPELAFELFEAEVPAMQTPSGIANSSYTISAVSSNTAHGTVSVSGTTITATPTEGYTVSGYELLSGSAAVSRNGNVFLVTPSSDCQIRINFAAKVSVGLTFVENGTVGSTVTGYIGEAMTMPQHTGAVPENYTFRGWVTDQVQDAASAPATVYAAGDSYTPSAAQTFYALYSWVEGEGTGEPVAKLVTSANELSAGMSVIIASANYNVAMSTTQKTNNRGQAAITKNSDGTIDYGDDVQLFTLEAGTVSGSYAFNTGNGYLYAASSSSNHLKTKSELDANGSFTIRVSSNGSCDVVAQGSFTRNNMEYNQSASLFSCYAASNTQTPVAIYAITKSGELHYTTGQSFVQPEIALAKPGLRLALESDLSAGFTVKPEMFADGAYTDLRMEFRLGDENAAPVVVTDYITLSTGDRVYMFDGIAPRMLNEKIYVKLYGTHKGTEYSVSVSTSIYAYCNWALSGSNAKLKTLVVDLMNYASAHQIYGNYKTDTLANRNLTPEQQALGTQTDPARTNITNASQAVIANPTASFTGAALYLQNKVEIRFTFSVPELTENTRLVVVVDGETVSYGADKFVANGSKYYVDVDALAAKQMRSAVDATLYEGETAISNTLRYSIESFVAWAYGRENFSSEALDAMMITMLKYGDSANAFFN